MEHELKDKSYINQFTTLVQTPVKFISSMASSKIKSQYETEIISIASLQYGHIFYIFTLSRNGKLTVWNQLSRACVRVLSLDALMSQSKHLQSQIFASNPQKLIEVFGLNALDGNFQSFVGFHLMLHLPFSFEPVFVVLDFKTDTNGNLFEAVPVAYLETTSNFSLLDFAVDEDYQTESEANNDQHSKEWTIWSVWESRKVPIQYTTLELALPGHNQVKPKAGCRWFNVKTEPELEAPLIGLEAPDIAHLEYIFKTFSLQFIAEACDYSGQLKLAFLWEHLLKFIHTRIESSLGETWHRFHSRLVELYNSNNETLGIFTKPASHLMIVLKRGHMLGLLRYADVIDCIGWPSNANNDDWISIAPSYMFQMNLTCIRPVALRVALDHFNQLVAYIHTNVISQEITNETSKELFTSVVSEMGLDDYALLVYERIKDQFQEEIWLECLSKIQGLVSRVGSLEMLSTSLIPAFEQSEILDTHPTRDLPIFTLKAISKSVKSIVMERFDFIQIAFYIFVIIKHLQIPNRVSGETFQSWKSLYCCYLRLKWLVDQPYAPAHLSLDNLSMDDYKPNTLLEFWIHKHIKLPSAGWADSITYGSLKVIGQLGWSVLHRENPILETEPPIKIAFELLEYSPAHQVLELLEKIGCPSSALFYVFGHVYLHIDVARSKEYFSKAAGGFPANLGIVMQVGTLTEYYHSIMQLCLERNILDMAIFFAKLAISTEVILIN